MPFILLIVYVNLINISNIIDKNHIIRYPYT